jgi:Domain of unknown function (DUF4259)
VGTWDATPFGNDDAGDFFFDLEDAEDVEGALRQALHDTAHAEGYLEAPDGAIAVAAAAVVAQGVGAAVDGLDGDRKQRIESLGLSRETATGLAALTRRALDRVEAADSELLELWEEAGEADAFRQSVAGIRAGLPA